MMLRSKKRQHDAKTYQTLRVWLVVLLGGQCAHYGNGHGKCNGKLEFDHINGRNWSMRSVNYAQRMRLLVKEASEDKLQLLCRRHNAMKG